MTDVIGRVEYTELLVRMTDFQGKINLVNSDLKSMGVRMDERGQALVIALDKASMVLNERLESMNQFRRQIDTERGSYITNDKLQTELKTVRAEIEGLRSLMEALKVQAQTNREEARKELSPLQTRQDYNKGRDTNTQNLIVAAIAAAGLLITLFRAFTGH